MQQCVLSFILLANIRF